MRQNRNIYAVIISFNPEIKLLDLEYSSIIPQVEKIIYVDNNSHNRNEIKNWLKDKERVSIIWLQDNEGIGVAQNLGIKMALNEGASHIIIFDQDTIVAPDFVKGLYESEQKAIQNGIKVGITGPIYSSHDNEYSYPILSIENNKIVNISIDEFDDYKVVSHIIASGELIKRQVFEEVGLMREDYFIEYVDFEYCFRAFQYGYRTIITKKACMNHQMGDNQIMIMGRKIGIYSPFRRYFTCRNSILIQREPIFPKVFKRHHLKLAIGKFIIACIYGPNRFEQIRYCCKGFMDGIYGISGKCSLI